MGVNKRKRKKKKENWKKKKMATSRACQVKLKKWIKSVRALGPSTPVKWVSHWSEAKQESEKMLANPSCSSLFKTPCYSRTVTLTLTPSNCPRRLLTRKKSRFRSLLLSSSSNIISPSKTFLGATIRAGAAFQEHQALDSDSDSDSDCSPHHYSIKIPVGDRHVTQL